MKKKKYLLAILVLSSGFHLLPNESLAMWEWCRRLVDRSGNTSHDTTVPEPSNNWVRDGAEWLRGNNEAISERESVEVSEQLYKRAGRRNQTVSRVIVFRRYLSCYSSHRALNIEARALQETMDQISRQEND